MEKSKLELAFEQRNNMLLMLADLDLSMLGLKASLKKAEQRQECLLDELKSITQDINNLLKGDSE